jgi:hypothetical protein
VEDFGSPTHGLRYRGGTGWKNHELLKVDGIVGMRAAIDDVHHGDGHLSCRRSSNIAEERKARCCRCGRCYRRRNAEDCICTENPLVWRSIERNHRVVDPDLILGMEAANGVRDLSIDACDCLAHAFAAIAGFFTVAQLNRFMCTGRRAGWNSGSSRRPIHPPDIHFDGRIAATVEDLARSDFSDFGHDCLSSSTKL